MASEPGDRRKVWSLSLGPGLAGREEPAGSCLSAGRSRLLCILCLPENWSSSLGAVTKEPIATSPRCFQSLATAAGTCGI